MGAGQSSDGTTTVNNKIRNENNVLKVNKSSLTQVTENINEKSTNTTMEASKECAQNLDAQNIINLAGITTGGDLNIGGSGEGEAVNLEQNVESSFHCIQDSKFANTISSSIMEEVVNQYKSIENDTIKDKIKTAVESENTAGLGSSSFFASPAGSTTNTEIENISNYQSLSEDEKHIHDITKNVIASNTDMIDTQKCFADVRGKQGIDASGAHVGGDVNIKNFSSTQNVTSVTDCVQKTSMVNDVLDDIASKLGITIEDTSTLTKETDADTSVATKNEQTGIGGAAGKVIKSVGDGINSALGGGVSGVIDSAGDAIAKNNPIAIIGMVVALLIVLGLIGTIIKVSMSGKDEDEDEDEDMGDDYDDDYDYQDGGFTSSNTSYMHQFITDSNTSK